MSETDKTKTGLIITVVVFCIIFAWIITFSILALAMKKPIFHKLSVIGPVGAMMHKVVYKGQTMRDEFYRQIAKHSNGNLQYGQQPAPIAPAVPASVIPETQL
jgi:hypothetical protein